VNAHRDDNKMALIQTFLGAAVPLWSMKIQAAPELYFAQSEIDRVLHTICEKGDLFLYRSKKSGQTAAVANDVAQAIATLAFCPGGVHTFGMHFEYKLPQEKVTEEIKKKMTYLERKLKDANRLVMGR